MSDLGELVGWVPFALRWVAGGVELDWCRVGVVRFVEPFFDQTIARVRAAGAGAGAGFRTTSGEVLDGFAGAEPAGLIFHASRCGSTLVAQMLAVAEGHVVLSEAGVVQAALTGVSEDGRTVSDEERVRVLRGLVGALGQGSERCFVKFAARATLRLGLIRRAFPEVPWVYCYRDPVEIVAGCLEGSRGVLPPGMAGAGLVEGEVAELVGLSPEAFWVRVVAGNFRAALSGFGLGEGRLVNYSELPGAVVEGLFGMSIAEEEKAAMLRVAGTNAKQPGRVFEADGERKRGSLSAAVQALVESEAGQLYGELEGLRLGV